MKKYLKIVITLFIFFLLFFIYDLYKDKKMYEEHLSLDVYSEINKLTSAIVESNEIYRDMLEKEAITLYDAERLKMNAYTILEIPQKYGALAYTFNRRKSEDFENVTATEAAQIADFFAEMSKDATEEDNLDEVIGELNGDIEGKIMQIQELHAGWIDAILNNVEGVSSTNGELTLDNEKYSDHYHKNSVSQDFWVDLVIDMDKNTRDFLADHNLTSIQDVLQ